MKIKKGDLVQMLAGKDRGKQGRVLDAHPRDGKVIVENLNIARRHQKPQPIRDASRMGGPQMIPGGIIDRPTAVPVGERHARLPDLQAPDARRLHDARRSRARRSRSASASARAAARRSTSDGRPPTETLRAAPEAALQRRAPRAAARSELGLSSIMQVPRITKITLNMGVGEAKTDAKVLDAAMEELTIIAGQRAQMRRARKSVAQFKLREGMPIGARVTLRGDRMWEFLDRLISIALPRIRDFRGLNPDVVRRARQLLARPARADHLPGDRLRQHQGDPRPRRRDHDHRRDGRAGRGAPARPRAPARDRERRD